MAEKKSQLSIAKEDFEQYVRKSVDGARALRDELKLQAHLGTEEAKARWGDLEKYLSHLDSVAHDLNQAAGAFGEKLLGIVRRAAPKRSVKRAPKLGGKRAAKRGVKAAAKQAGKRSASKGKPKKRTRR